MPREAGASFEDVGICRQERRTGWERPCGQTDRPCAKAQQQERTPPTRGINSDLEWRGQGGEHGEGRRGAVRTPKTSVCLGEE